MLRPVYPLLVVAPPGPGVNAAALCTYEPSGMARTQTAPVPGPYPGTRPPGLAQEP